MHKQDAVVSLLCWEEEEEWEEVLDGLLLTGWLQGSAEAGLQTFLSGLTGVTELQVARLQWSSPAFPEFKLH